MTADASPTAGVDLEVPAWWLWALTAVALAVRIIGLNGGLWVDEIYSLLHSFRPPLAEILTTFPRDNRHPFYSVLAHLSLRAFGESPWTIRLPALLFGTATIPALYLLGSRLLARRQAFLAAALLAVSYHHVWFSQNARGYALLGFFAVLGAWLLLRCFDDPRRRWAVAYGAAIALGAWTHLTMVFVAVGHAAACGLAFAAARPRREDPVWRRVALGFVLSAVFTVALYAPVLGDVTHFFGGKPSGLRGISTPGWALAESVRVLLAGLGGAGTAAALAGLAAAGLLFGAGLLAMWRRHRLALGLFVLPGFVTIAGALAARGTMYPRFFFSQAPYAVLIAVCGAFVLAGRLAARRSGSGARLGTAAALVLIALSALSLPRDWRYPKQDFGGARAWVDAHRGAPDVAATTDVTTEIYRDYLHAGWIGVANAAELADLRRGRRVWLVYSFPAYLERGAPDVAAVVRQECGTAKIFPGTVGGGDIHVCELGPVP